MSIVLYSTDYCPFCIRAKKLLKSKNLDFKEVNLSSNAEELTKLKQRTGMQTVPQIFIHDKLIGGFQELYELEQSAKLDALVNTPSN
ncbi:MAG: glutaredoxin 3 [Bdellovibrionaceae bacterium]|nr:glutaredoxin 3 [Pseudobdellovibrionaceae bacterium]